MRAWRDASRGRRSSCNLWGGDRRWLGRGLGPDVGVLLRVPSIRRIAQHADTLSPERRLMLAVLEDALCLLRRATARSSRRSQRLAAEVRDWTRSNDRVWPFSFCNVCEALDVNVDDLRRRLRGALPAHRAGVERQLAGPARILRAR